MNTNVDDENVNVQFLPTGLHWYGSRDELMQVEVNKSVMKTEKVFEAIIINCQFIFRCNVFNALDDNSQFSGVSTFICLHAWTPICLCR